MSTAVYTTLAFQTGAGITGLPAATASGEPVTYEQLNAAIEGVAWKDSVRAASTANVTVSGPGSAIDGVTLSSGDRVLLKDQSTASQNGIYIFNGAAVAMTRSTDASTFAELEGAVLTVEEGSTNAGTSWRQSATNGVIDTNDVTWTTFGTSVGAASESSAGKAELATQAETDTGTDDARIVTPLKLATWSGRIRKHSANVGDNSATSFNFDHNFNTRDVMVSIHRLSGNYENVQVEIQRPSVNRVTLVFSTAPTTDQFRVVILG